MEPWNLYFQKFPKWCNIQSYSETIWGSKCWMTFGFITWYHQSFKPFLLDKINPLPLMPTHNSDTLMLIRMYHHQAVTFSSDWIAILAKAHEFFCCLFYHFTQPNCSPGKILLTIQSPIDWHLLCEVYMMAKECNVLPAPIAFCICLNFKTYSMLFQLIFFPLK